MIRVLVVDDQQLVREGIAMMLSADPGLEVVGEAADGQQALDLAERLHPDVVLMDVRMPGMDGIEATRRLTLDRDDGDHPTTVLVLTTFDEDGTLYGALRAGASGFLLKHTAPTDLVRAVRQVAGGDAWIDPSVAPRVIDRLRELSAPSPDGLPDLSVLTPRELEVLTEFADAPTNTELSKRLFLSETTVKTHVSRLLMKTGSHDRSQLVALAYRSGLARP